MKFATNNLHSFPPRSPHLDYVATLPWKDKSPNLLKITNDMLLKNRTECDKNEILHVIWLK